MEITKANLKKNYKLLNLNFNIHGNQSYYCNVKDGSIVNKDTMKILALHDDGYKQVSIKCFNHWCTMYVHHLIFFHFFNMSQCILPQGYNINHKNKDKSDNSIQNLEMITIGKNLENRILPKNKPKNINLHKQVRSICTSKNLPTLISKNSNECAKLHGINQGIVSSILNNKKYYKSLLSFYNNEYYTLQYLEDDTPKVKFEKQYNVMIDKNELSDYEDLVYYNDHANDSDNSIDV
jgi:hypothetical protein